MDTSVYIILFMYTAYSYMPVKVISDDSDKVILLLCASIYSSVVYYSVQHYWETERTEVLCEELHTFPTTNH